jgi:hypothetical protein
MKRPGDDNKEHQPKVSKFKLPSRPALVKKAPAPFPKACEGVRYTAERAKKTIAPGCMPQELKDYLGDCDIAFGIDIEVFRKQLLVAIALFEYISVAGCTFSSRHMIGHRCPARKVGKALSDSIHGSTRTFPHLTSCR